MSETAPARPVHVLVDLENNQPTLDDVRQLVPDLTDVWLFHSPPQAAHLSSYQALGSRHMPVPISRAGKNALDFHLTFYVGYIAARYPDASIVVVAIDRGYAPMVEHAKTLGFQVKSVPFKKKAAAKKPAAKKVPAKKKPAKKTPAKKAAPKKTAGKQAGGKTGAKKSAAKKAAASPGVSTPVKKAAPAKAATKGTAKSAQAAAATKAKAAIPSEQGTRRSAQASTDKIVASLRKMGNRRPMKLKALERHLASLLGNGATDAAVTALLGNLYALDAVRVSGDAVAYGSAVTR